MTREEATTYLKVIWNRYKAEYEIERETLDAYNMAIEALSEPKTIICVDTHPHDKGVVTVFKKHGDKLTLDKATELAEPSIVRCKECKHYIVEGITTRYGWCHEYKHSVDEDDYCSYGERQCNYFG